MACDPQKLREFLERTGLSYKQNSRSFYFDCPKCKHKDKLYIEKRTGRFICFFCAEQDGYKGKPEFALADLALMQIGEVRKQLYGEQHSGTAFELDLGLAEFFGDEDVLDEDFIDIPEMQWPVDYFPIDHKSGKKGADYLAGRGIDLETAKRYNLRYAPAKRRVIFPVELGERLVGWQERLIVPNRYWDEEAQKHRETPKMLSSKDIPSAHVVMFANRLAGSKHAVVCEGPVDALKADLCGCNVATMGKAIGQGQIDVIRNPQKLTQQQVGMMKFGGIEKIFLALDPDAARETSRLVREFSDLEVYVMEFPKGYKDFGELSFEETYRCFKNAKRAGAGSLFISLR